MLVVEGLRLEWSPMNDSPERSFGLLIAYVVPGFVCLAGASRFSTTIAAWMSIAPTSEPSVGGFLYVAVGSLGAGLVANAVRWAAVDTLLHRTGLRPPQLDFSQLQANLDAFQLAVEHNYRYYQFHASMALAAVFFGIADQCSVGLWRPWVLAGYVALVGVLLVTSRDCLRRYYERTSQILGSARHAAAVSGGSELPAGQTP